jgi:PAS domain S-box-containing protein
MKNESVEQLIYELVETSVFDSIGDGISIQDTDYKILYQNSKHKLFVGEHTGEYCYKAYEKRSHICEGCPLVMTFKDGLPHTEERTAPTDRGILHFEITASPLRDKTGKIIAGIEVARDITQRKRANESTEQLLKLNELILSTAGDGIYGLDLNGNTTFVNPAAAKMIGWNPEELLGMNQHNVLHHSRNDGSPYPPEECPIYAAFKDGKVHRIDNEVFWRKDGSSFPVEYISTPMRNKTGELEGSVVVFRDITGRKKAEEEQQKTHKLESIGILAGGIAHDFNNLLAGILNNVYISKMHIDRESKAYKSLESAENAISRAANLTQQLLTFSKGGVPIKKIASIIEIIGESTAFALKGSNVKCEYIVADDLWPVEVDEGQMNQVIHNLILNADQAMPEGGMIRIYTENFDLSSDTGLPLEEGRYLKIVIQDQGIGIEKEYLQKIFDPYFTTKEAGRGLGLSITYSIVKNHDGLLTVESEKGTGTTFTIYLPASDKQIEEKETVEDIFIAGEGKILLMDDEEVVRNSVGEILKELGYEVGYAKDGSEAIELYRKAKESAQPFDAVILDLTIPGGMGGKEAVKKIRETNPQVKAIISSGYSNDPVMANFRDYGFDAVISKPLNIMDLSKVLYTMIKNKYD